MSNVLKASKREQIVALGRLGWSIRRIERETGIRRETISGYLKAAEIPVRPPRGWGHGELKRRDPKPAIEKITEEDPATVVSNPAKERITDSRRQGSACDEHRPMIEARLRAGCLVTSIFQELVEEHGFAHRYAAVSRYVKKLRASEGTSAHPVIQTAPGEECQVDYGDGPLVRHPTQGRYRRTRMFVLTLGYSRKSVRFLVWKSSTEIWCQLHEKAFRRLGGTTQTVVLDNLKEGVLKPDIFDPQLNPLYRDMLAHYGVVALPCRVRDPNRKGKVESAVAHAQKACRGRRFEDLESAQAFLDRWESRWADTRIHGTTKRQVLASFEEEKPALQALPITPFRYYRRLSRKVNINGCVEVERAFYSAPPRSLGMPVEVQVDDFHVRLLCPTTGTLLREHTKERPGGYRIKPQDKPKSTPPQVSTLLTRSNNLGEFVGKLCSHIYAHEAQTGVRRIQGIVGLAKKHGKGPLDDACRTAFECGAPTYRFVKTYLQKATCETRHHDPLIRELGEYQKLIQTLTQGELFS